VSELKKLTADHPQFANFDVSDSVVGDGLSTGAPSGTATPQTAGTPGQPRLKLTFNNPNAAESATSAATSTVNGADADED
jgi:ATP-dependent helicase STH1/SNF2